VKTSFRIEGRLPGLNEIINANRNHRMAGAAQKKKSDEYCAIAIMAWNVPVFTGPVRVHFDWHVLDRRDPDNIRTGAKFILDALVETRRLGNDDQKAILGLSDSFTRVEKDPCVVVTIESV
jgi:hypothetical protein